MKENDLLHGPITDRLCQTSTLVDVTGKPTTLVDFTVPTEGFEAPWGAAKINFIYDSARLDGAAAQHGGSSSTGRAKIRDASPTRRRRTSSAPRFLKQVVIETTPEPGLLQSPVPDDDGLRGGHGSRCGTTSTPCIPISGAAAENFPATGAAQRQLLDDGEVDITISFYPSEASSLIAQGLLPEIRPGLHARRWHHRQRPLRGNPLQRPQQGRRHGGRQFPHEPRGTGPQAGHQPIGATRPCWRSASWPRRSASCSTSCRWAWPP